jgi:D-alanyl-D-alanine carboxypeptidase (penicillin-binding protein 5/6)
MQRKKQFVCVLLLLSFCLLSQISKAEMIQHVNARSAVLLDMEDGRVLFEQNPDELIAPASITKILTLYIVFEAIGQGEISLSDKVYVSRRAASTSGSRMGIKANTFVPLEEIIKGIAVVSGNDACIAVAEHISGSVERFVSRMNAKARDLGMTSSHFMTPNGLPADGQVTTARDIARLSVAYLHRFPESLTIHSMTAYTYGKHSHHNANRLLGKCQGVDGLKTGFVCSSGYNISATAKRNHTRIIAVVMGARSPWVRCSEAERLIEAGFRETGAPYNDLKCIALKPAPKRKAHSTTVANKAGKRGETARAHGKPEKKLASKGKKNQKSTGKELSVKNGKTVSRHASAKENHEKAAKGSKHDERKQSAGVRKSGGTKSASGAKTSRGSGVKSAKSNKKEAKTASAKKNHKDAPHARESKKKAKG